MSETDFTVDSALPRITAVSAHEDFAVTVTWADGKTEVVDLAPAVFRYKVYAPLRADARLFSSIHVADDGFAIAWGDDEIDMASTTVEDLAGQAMTAADFSAFMKRHSYTLDSVAAELGISRRLAAYYQRGRQIPRYIAFACAHLDARAKEIEEAAPTPQQVWLSELFATPIPLAGTELSAACSRQAYGPVFFTDTNLQALGAITHPSSCLSGFLKVTPEPVSRPAHLRTTVRPVFYGGGSGVKSKG